MALTEITLQALQMYGQGMSQAFRDIAITRTLQGVNERVNQIRTSEMNEAKKRAELEALSQQASLHLAGMQVDAGRLKQVAEAIAPSGPSSIAEALVSPSEPVRQRGYAALNATSEQKRTLGDTKDLESRMDKFRKLKPIQTLDEGLSNFRQARESLKLGTPQAQNMVIKQLVKAVEGGRLSDVDFRLGQVGQDWISRIKKFGGTNFFNEATASDLRELNTFLDQAEGAMSRELKTRTDKEAEAFARRRGVDPELVKQEYTSMFNISAQQQSQDMGKIEVRPYDGKYYRVRVVNGKVVENLGEVNGQ